MKRALAVTLIVAVALLGPSCKRKATDESPAASAAAPVVPGIVGATLLDGLGDYHFAITTAKPEVQRWFDQGLMLTYGFNHDAAERSFLLATELDPDCAMFWWGASLVLGPHVDAA